MSLQQPQPWPEAEGTKANTKRMGTEWGGGGRGQ